MRSVSRSLTAAKNGFRASHLVVLGVALLGSQLLARPMSAQQGGGPLAALTERVAALDAANADLTRELADVQTKTAPISVVGSDFTITGKNVFIVDGSGITEHGSGLGNLQIGYNHLRGDGTDARTGSHNLIVGDRNNYIGG